jgi:hypothetical protein
MLRPLLLTGTLIATALEPTLGETDPFRYALTQGGLLVVVLVLLLYISQKHKSELADEKGRTEEERRRTEHAEKASEVLVALVGETNAAMQKNISVGEAQEKAIHRLARAVERIEDRRAGDDRRGGA